MKKFFRRVLKPISTILTKFFFDIEVVKPQIKKIYWQESNAFKWASSYIIKNQIEGDYLEFGVWKGNSFIEMYRQMKINSKIFYETNEKKKPGKIKNIFKDMRFHAFDSFEGLPESNLQKPIQYFSGNYSAEEDVFMNNLIKSGIDLNKVTVTKGWFNQSLNEECIEKINLKNIAVAYIDCDLLESTLPVLNFINPYIKTGTVLIFDDWFRNAGNINNGIQGAVLKWLNKNKNITLQHYHNSDTRTATFIVRKSEIQQTQSKIDCV
jgi:O-methyltransferase